MSEDPPPASPKTSVPTNSNQNSRNPTNSFHKSHQHSSNHRGDNNPGGKDPQHRSSHQGRERDRTYSTSPSTSTLTHANHDKRSNKDSISHDGRDKHGGEFLQQNATNPTPFNPLLHVPASTSSTTRVYEKQYVRMVADHYKRQKMQKERDEIQNKSGGHSRGGKRPSKPLLTPSLILLDPLNVPQTEEEFRKYKNLNNHRNIAGDTDVMFNLAHLYAHSTLLFNQYKPYLGTLRKTRNSRNQKFHVSNSLHPRTDASDSVNPSTLQIHPKILNMFHYYSALLIRTSKKATVRVSSEIIMQSCSFCQHPFNDLYEPLYQTTTSILQQILLNFFQHQQQQQQQQQIQTQHGQVTERHNMNTEMNDKTDQTQLPHNSEQSSNAILTTHPLSNRALKRLKHRTKYGDSFISTKNKTKYNNSSKTSSKPTPSNFAAEMELKAANYFTLSLKDRSRVDRFRHKMNMQKARRTKRNLARALKAKMLVFTFNPSTFARVIGNTDSTNQFCADDDDNNAQLDNHHLITVISPQYLQFIHSHMSHPINVYKQATTSTTPTSTSPTSPKTTLIADIPITVTCPQCTSNNVRFYKKHQFSLPFAILLPHEHANRNVSVVEKSSTQTDTTTTSEEGIVEPVAPVQQSSQQEQHASVSAQ